ncbi:MAG TPA: hypothetical protein VIO16_02035 [Dehalococcoidia bacterium]
MTCRTASGPTRSCEIIAKASAGPGDSPLSIEAAPRPSIVSGDGPSPAGGCCNGTGAGATVGARPPDVATADTRRDSIAVLSSTIAGMAASIAVVSSTSPSVSRTTDGAISATGTSERLCFS